MRLASFEVKKSIKVGIHHEGYLYDAVKIWDTTHKGKAPFSNLPDLVSAGDTVLDILKKKYDRFLDSTTPEHAVEREIAFSEDTVIWCLPLLQDHRLFSIGANSIDYMIQRDWRPQPFSRIIMRIPALMARPNEPTVIANNNPIGARWGAELCAILKRGGRFRSKRDVRDAIFGYTIFNDVAAPSMWDDYREFTEPSEAKFADVWYLPSSNKHQDSWGSIGPVIVTQDEIPDPNDVIIHNRFPTGEDYAWNSSEMLYDIEDSLLFLSKFITFRPTDMLAGGALGIDGLPFLPSHSTGVFEAELEDFGSLINPIRDQRDEGFKKYEGFVTFAERMRVHEKKILEVLENEGSIAGYRWPREKLKERLEECRRYI